MILRYIEFVNETNLMVATGKGSNVQRLEYDKIDMDSFIDQADTLKKCSVPGKDKEGKTIHTMIGTQQDPINPDTKISTY
jgi:hypothetical protein